MSHIHSVVIIHLFFSVAREILSYRQAEMSFPVIHLLYIVLSLEDFSWKDGRMPDHGSFRHL